MWGAEYTPALLLFLLFIQVAEGKTKVRTTTLPPPKNRNTTEKAWVFLHFRKCGGTHLCNLVKQNKVPSHRNYNCNLKMDGPKDLDMDARRPYGRFNTCEDKAAFINEEGYKFVAVERYFDANLCPHFRYLTVLRHPIKRIISNMVFQAYRPSDIMQWARHDSQTVRFYGGTPIVDNYYIRVLNGPDLYFAPLGSIRREHLERAKEILSKFEVVMTLEDWARTSRQLVVKLGMKEKDVNRIENTRKNSLGEYRFNGREVEKPLDDELVLELTILNALDIELFEFASQLSLALTHKIPFHP